MKNNKLIKKILNEIAALRQQDFENSFDPFYYIFNKGEAIKSKIAELHEQLNQLGYDAA